MNLPKSSKIYRYLKVYKSLLLIGSSARFDQTSRFGENESMHQIVTPPVKSRQFEHPAKQASVRRLIIAGACSQSSFLTSQQEFAVCCDQAWLRRRRREGRMAARH
jgi:hypothetical protein